MAEKKTIKKQAQKGKQTKVDGVKQTLMALSALTVRADIASRLGKSFGDDRDIYEALGYKKLLTYNDYVAKYKRQDIARAVVDKPVGVSWSKQPLITESAEKETDFEKGWVSLVKRLRVFHFLSRVDR